MHSDHPTLVVANVRLAHASADLCWSECSGPRVTSICLSSEASHVDQSLRPPIIDAKDSLMLPSLCHSHIHLDKCFILDRCELVTGCVQTPRG
ncbi:hypothetical protein FB451DRAFT_561733 [Mycena latifolia]|nr:hypothetical protein FB451DRAFT_561733 [Mycena latifolia]